MLRDEIAEKDERARGVTGLELASDLELHLVVRARTTTRRLGRATYELDVVRRRCRPDEKRSGSARSFGLLDRFGGSDDQDLLPLRRREIGGAAKALARLRSIAGGAIP